MAGVNNTQSNIPSSDILGRLRLFAATLNSGNNSNPPIQNGKITSSTASVWTAYLNHVQQFETNGPTVK